MAGGDVAPAGVELKGWAVKFNSYTKNYPTQICFYVQRMPNLCLYKFAKVQTVQGRTLCGPKWMETKVQRHHFLEPSFQRHRSGLGEPRDASTLRVLEGCLTPKHASVRDA